MKSRLPTVHDVLHDELLKARSIDIPPVRPLIDEIRDDITAIAVSYTHLDVYKRQSDSRSAGAYTRPN